MDVPTPAADPKPPSAAPPVTITPTTDGPLHVTGGARVVAPDGKVVREGTSLWLCRCGHSASKPFCDSSHKRAGFKT